MVLKHIRGATPVANVHACRLPGGMAQAARLIDGLSSSTDALWPHERWPRLRFDGPLRVGARGGHGPVRYEVVAWDPGRAITFRFTGPAGFDGTHWVEATPHPDGSAELRHVLAMRTRGLARVSWPLVFGPMHNALIEDALAKARVGAVGWEKNAPRWSLGLRALRWVAARLTGRRDARK